jgi:hypothetical protein
MVHDTQRRFLVSIKVIFIAFEALVFLVVIADDPGSVLRPDTGYLH